jgi:hypothetical protein
MPSFGEAGLGVRAKGKKLFRTPKTILQAPEFATGGGGKKERPPPSKSLISMVWGLVAFTLISFRGVILRGITRSSIFLGISVAVAYLRIPKNTPETYGFYRMLDNKKPAKPCG